MEKRPTVLAPATPMPWEIFTTLGVEYQRRYISFLASTFEVGKAEIARMMGATLKALKAYFESRGLGADIPEKGSIEGKKAWDEFMSLKGQPGALNTVLLCGNKARNFREAFQLSMDSAAQLLDVPAITLRKAENCRVTAEEAEEIMAAINREFSDEPQEASSKPKAKPVEENAPVTAKKESKPSAKPETNVQPKAPAKSAAITSEDRRKILTDLVLAIAEKEKEFDLFPSQMAKLIGTKTAWLKSLARFQIPLNTAEQIRTQFESFDWDAYREKQEQLKKEYEPKAAVAAASTPDPVSCTEANANEEPRETIEKMEQASEPVAPEYHEEEKPMASEKDSNALTLSGSVDTVLNAIKAIYGQNGEITVTVKPIN